LENAVPVVLRVGSSFSSFPLQVFKAWLCPVRLASASFIFRYEKTGNEPNYGMKPQDLRKIREILEKNESMIQEKWDEFNSRKK
jgi:hypothetical protein